VSEQKTKAIDVYSLFVRELRTRLNVCKNIYSSVLYNKIQKCIEKVYDINIHVCVVKYCYTLIIPWIINVGFTE